MRTIKFILQKEFKQIFRDKGLLPIIFVMPIIQLLILANAATFEIKNFNIAVHDADVSSESSKLITHINSSNYLTVVSTTTDFESAWYLLEQDEADIIVSIPQKFNQQKFGTRDIQLMINAIDGIKAGLGNGYLNAVISSYFSGTNQLVSNRQTDQPNRINIEFSNWYNVDLDYKIFMVPGILVLLVTMIGAFLTSMNIVREKEIGTIEQLNVTPIKKYQFIAGKLIPFLIIAVIEFTFGLILAVWIYQVPIEGSLILIYSFTVVYLIAILGIGLFISTITDTQQQAMFISWFILVVFILMSGLFTPIENMPVWAQKITYLNPVKYFIEFMRMVMLKGAGFEAVKMHFIVLSLAGLFILSMSVWRYRKTE